MPVITDRTEWCLARGERREAMPEADSDAVDAVHAAVGAVGRSKVIYRRTVDML